MRFTGVMLICFATLTLSLIARAQDCGNSWNTIRVIDNKERPIEGATIELSKIDDVVIATPNIIWDGDKQVYSMIFASCRGITYAGLHVRANGYDPLLGQVTLPLNSKEKGQRLVIKLRRIGTKEIAYIDTITLLTGTIYDPNGALVPNIQISAKDKRNRVFRTKTDGDGEYSMELPVGLYEISINQVLNFKFYLVKEFFVAPPLNKPMKLDYAIYR